MSVKKKWCEVQEARKIERMLKKEESTIYRLIENAMLTKRKATKIHATPSSLALKREKKTQIKGMKKIIYHRSNIKHLFPSYVQFLAAF